MNPVDEATGYLTFYRMAMEDETIAPQRMISDLINSETNRDKVQTGKLPVLEAIRQLAGKSTTYIRRLECILTLPENAIEAVRNGKLNKTAPWFRILSP